MNLKRRVLSASLWNLAGTGGQQAISFLLFIYLARQLAPADVGLIALAVVLLDILGSMSRCGQVEALQRYGSLDNRVTSTSFWFLALTGAGSCLLILLVGCALRAVEGQVILGNVLLLLAPLSALQAWNAVPEAILKQRLDFRLLTVRSWTATLAGGALAIYMVHFELGIYALVGQRLGTALARTAMLWMLVRWKPRIALYRGEARKLMAVGVEIMLAGLAGTVNLRIADSITGVFLGAQQLGFLRLGWRFLDIIIQFAVLPISGVALSSFSKLRDDPEGIRRAYLRLTQFMALASLPMFFGLGAVADILVPLIVGEKWLPSVAVLQILGFLVLPGTINYFFAPLLVSVGATRVVLKQSIAQVFVTVVLLGLGAQWGLQGILVAHIVRACLISVYNLHAMNRAVNLRWLAVVRMLMPPAIACGVMMSALWLIKPHLSHHYSGIPLLALLVVVGAVAYGAALLAGDAIGLWKGYVAGAVRSLAAAFAKPRSAA